VRVPDVAYLSWDRFPDHRQGDEPVPAVVPDLAIEVLSKGNTPAEMARKRRKYFEAGVHLVWIINPSAKTVIAYRDFDHPLTLSLADTLSADPILPGFSIPIKLLFAELDRQR
jgi:Uma2 family endonuclease